MSIDERAAISHLQALLRIAETVRRAPLPAALDEVAGTLGAALGYGTVVVSLVRPAWDDLEVVAVHGAPEVRAALLGRTSTRASWDALLDERSARRGAHHLRHGDGVPAEHDASWWVPSAPAAGPGKQDAWHPQDALFAPLRDARGRLLGVLSVDEPTSGRRPTDLELDVLVSAAGHLAAAVEQALAAEFAGKLRHGTGVMLSVSAQLHAGRSTQEVLDAVCVGINQALSFRNVAALLACDDGYARAAASVGFEPGAGPLEAAYPLDALRALLAPEHHQLGCVLLDEATANAIVPPEIPRAHRSTHNGIGPRAWRNHWLMVPITGEDGGLRGFIWADDPADRLLPPKPRLQALRLFADLASGALETSERLERMRVLAERDPLTGLPNRRALDGFLADRDASLALLVCDLDHFKRVNDQLGHAAGDEALVAFAGILEGLARSSDLAVRLGGEEFALLLPGADSAAAFAVAERLLRATASASRACRRA